MSRNQGGSTSITQVGTVTSGTWNGTDIAAGWDYSEPDTQGFITKLAIDPTVDNETFIMAYRASLCEASDMKVVYEAQAAKLPQDQQDKLEASAEEAKVEIKEK